MSILKNLKNVKIIYEDIYWIFQILTYLQHESIKTLHLTTRTYVRHCFVSAPIAVGNWL